MAVASPRRLLRERHDQLAVGAAQLEAIAFEPGGRCRLERTQKLLLLLHDAVRARRFRADPGSFSMKRSTAVRSRGNISRLSKTE